MDPGFHAVRPGAVRPRGCPPPGSDRPTVLANHSLGAKQVSRNSLCRCAVASQTLSVEPVRSYVICCVQRTGSWLLAHTLADTGYAGRPSDYFDEQERKTHTREWGLPAGDLTPYIAAVREHATTPNGVLGSKLMWNDFYWHRQNSVRPSAGTDAGLEFMRTAFGAPQFVWLRRRDKVRQGISWWRAFV